MDMEDLVKSVNEEDKGCYIRGWASTPDLDSQNDVVDPKGIQIDEFLEFGYINYEHDSNKRIGVPTSNCYVDPNKGLYVEAKLLMDRPEARKMWDLAKSLVKSGVNRKLGFSIEGKVLGRDMNDQSIVRGVQITNIALTERPANKMATWETLVKSMTTGTEVNPTEMVDGSALRIQSLSDSIFNLTYQMKGLNFGEVRDIAKALDETERYSDEVATVLLQLGYGLSFKEASSRVLNSKK